MAGWRTPDDRHPQVTDGPKKAGRSLGKSVLQTFAALPNPG
jgi:hypothetical protein